MKQVSTDGKIWMEERDGIAHIGLTRKFIDEKLGECFHMLPADAVRVVSKGPLLAVETNDGLESIRSPVEGRILFFNDKARNFPDKITEEDVLFRIEVPVPKATKKAVAAKPTLAERLKQAKEAKVQQVNQNQLRWFDDPQDDDLQDW